MAIGRVAKNKKIGTVQKNPAISRTIPKSRPAPTRHISQSPVPKTASASQGGSSFGGGGGGTGAAYSSGAALGASATGLLAPTMPTDEEWLAGDTSYQAQMAALQKAMSDYQTQDNQARSAYETDFGVNTQNLARSRTESLGNQENDFGARGMINSGLFADARSKLEGDFSRRGDEMTRGRDTFLQGRNNQLGNFRSEQNLTQQSALAEALARRAAQFGGF